MFEPFVSLMLVLFAVQLAVITRALGVMVAGIRAMRADLRRLIDVQDSAPS